MRKPKTIGVSLSAHAWLADEACARGESVPATVDRLIREVERWRFAEAARLGYVRLRQGPEAWAAFWAEVAALDGDAPEE
jgi:hypothetical protein